MLHKDSSAVKVIENTNIGLVLQFNGESDLASIAQHFAKDFSSFLQFRKTFTPSQVNQKQFQEFSAYSVTEKLAGLLNQIAYLK